MSDGPTRWHWFTLAGIVVVGGILRFTALDQGIPFALGIDEPEIMERAVRMMKSGDFHPHFFDYPGFYIYFQAVVATARFMLGSMQGLWPNLNQAPVSEFYLWGRAATAAFGTATIVLVYLAGRRISMRVGLVAAAVFALQSLHVRESHFVLTDVPMTFFVTLAWVLTMRACERQQWRACLWVGIAVGASAATKYNGGVAILLPMLGVWLSERAWLDRVRAITLTLLASGVTFLTLAPYTVLALPEFLNAFGYLAHMYADGPARPEAAWLTYLKHLRNNFSIPGLAAGAVGLVLAVRAGWHAPRSTAGRAWLSAAGFAAIYFWMIAGQRLVWGRYLLPMLPFLCVLAAGALVAAADAVARRWPRPSVGLLTVAALTAVLVAQPTMNVVAWIGTVSKESTHAQVYAWVRENIPAGAKIASETREVLLPADRYTMVYPRRLVDHDTDHYQREGVSFLLASSQSFRVAFYVNPPDAEALRGYTELFRRNEHLITFMPSDQHPGPEYRIYRVVAPQ